MAPLSKDRKGAVRYNGRLLGHYSPTGWTPNRTGRGLGLQACHVLRTGTRWSAVRARIEGILRADDAASGYTRDSGLEGPEDRVCLTDECDEPVPPGHRYCYPEHCDRPYGMAR